MHHVFSPSRLIPVLACAFLCGCSNDKEVSYKSGGMTHTLAQGSDALQKDFPLPIYPKAAASGSVSAQGEENEQSKMLLLTTTDPIEKVSEFYQAELSKGGWSVENVQSMPKLITIQGVMKEKKLESNVTINDDAGKTTIMLNLASTAEIKKEDEEPSENFQPNKVTPPTD